MSIDANNFINDIAGLKVIQESLSPMHTTAKRGNSSASNVKFGKLTLQRGPNKDLADVRMGAMAEPMKAKNSRNPSPNKVQGAKSKFSGNYTRSLDFWKLSCETKR